MRHHDLATIGEFDTLADCAEYARRVEGRAWSCDERRRTPDGGRHKPRRGLTPAYLAGRFWTERELGALLAKATLIPVLHNVTFDDVKEYSGILPDLAGFTTANDSIKLIAEKIAAAVTVAP